MQRIFCNSSLVLKICLFYLLIARLTIPEPAPKSSLSWNASCLLQLRNRSQNLSKIPYFCRLMCEFLNTAVTKRLLLVRELKIWVEFASIQSHQKKMHRPKVTSIIFQKLNNTLIMIRTFSKKMLLNNIICERHIFDLFTLSLAAQIKAIRSSVIITVLFAAN